jgi:hypothetical protein
MNITRRLEQIPNNFDDLQQSKLNKEIPNFEQNEIVIPKFNRMKEKIGSLRKTICAYP